MVSQENLHIRSELITHSILGVYFQFSFLLTQVGTLTQFSILGITPNP